MMDTPSVQFFEIQRYRKRMSLMFYGLFMIVVAVHALALLIVCALAALAITGEVRLSWSLASLVGLGLYFVASMVIQARRIGQGGQSLAKQLGAVRLFVSQVQTDETGGQEPIYHKHYIQVGRLADFPSSYRRYYEFAEQLSLAAGISLPKLYVMPSEMGINAFVAGFDEHDTVMILTQGAVEKLSNEALYGLIGHEFGHIIHGDAWFNLRLYVMMAGLSLFYEMAERLERFIFGDFHANYHAYTISDYRRNYRLDVIPSSFNNLSDWVLQYSTAKTPKNISDEVATMFLLFKAPLLFVFVLCYMFGLFGMASMNWLKGRFNHQRELLADATSMQLTRSFGIIELLQTINEHDTVLYTTKVSAMDYFFFANPSQDSHLFATHPRIDERIRALYEHDYDELGAAIIKYLDVEKLEKSHKQATVHTPIMRLSDEVQAVQPEYFHHAYEHFADVVIDGRLVVDQAWFDGFDNVNLAKSTKMDKDEGFDLSVPLSNIDDTIWLYPAWANFTHACDVPNEKNSLRLSDLPWLMVKTLRVPLGALAVLECLLLCRFEKINPKQAFGLQSIYLNLPNQLPSGLPNLSEKQASNDVSDDVILPRVLDESLLVQACRLNRKHDQITIRQLLNALSNQLMVSPTSLSDLHKRQMQMYKDGLVRLFATQHKQCSLLPLGKNRLRYQMDKLLQAGILWRVCVALDKGLQRQLPSIPKNLVSNNQSFGVVWHKNVLDCLSDLPIPTWALIDKTEPTTAHQVMMVLLAFLVGVQDNSLLLARHEAMLSALVRQARLLGVVFLDKHDDWLLLIERTHDLTVADWVGLIDVLTNATPAMRTQYQNTLHTALLFDGAMNQKESDILAIFDTILC